jgi:tRNA nucleotidyltransferase (CCA-adding enzyme)
MIQFRIPEYIISILNSLKKNGYEAYIVGGAVRDALLERQTTDWDVATSATAHEIQNIFHGFRQFLLKHHTVTMLIDGHHVHVTTFRGNLPGIEHDLRHRDFTVNAMAYVPETGQLIDPFAGKNDICRKIIRAVEDPENRMKEDPIRLIRAIRMAAELSFRIDHNTRMTIKDMASQILSPAPERIRDELVRLLMCAKPSKGFYLLLRTNLLKYILPELLEGYLKRQNAGYHQYTIFKHTMETVDRIKPEISLRLAALLHDIAKPTVRRKIAKQWRFYGHEKTGTVLAEEILSRLKFERNMINKISRLVRYHMINYHSGWSDAAVRRFMNRVGMEYIPNLLELRRADVLSHISNTNQLEQLNELESRIAEQLKRHVPNKTNDLCIDGNRVMEILGLSQGPEVGRVLKILMTKIIDCPELNNEQDLIAILKQLK